MSSHTLGYHKKGLQTRRQKTTTKFENYSQRHQNESQNGSKNRFQERKFWFLLNLVFVQQYKGFTDFHCFWAPRGGQKTIKKTTQTKKKKLEKYSPKPFFFEKQWKLGSKWSPIWTPNSLPIRSRGVIFLTWGPRAPKEGPRAPEEGPRVPKESPRAPKGAQKGGKEHQKDTKSKIKLYETPGKKNNCKRKSKAMPTQQWFFI